MTSKKDFHFWEQSRGRIVNVVEGLELHQSVLTSVEQLIMEQAITGWVGQGLKVSPVPCPCSSSAFKGGNLSRAC